MTQTTPTKRKPQAVKAAPVTRSSGNPIADVIAARGWPLFVWLVILSVLSVIAVLDTLVPFNPVGVLLGLLQVGFVVGLWFWKRWAFFGIIGACLLLIVLVALALLQTHRLNLIPLGVSIIVVVGTVEVVSPKLERFH